MLIMVHNNAHPLIFHDLTGNALHVYARGYSISSQQLKLINISFEQVRHGLIYFRQVFHVVKYIHHENLNIHKWVSDIKLWLTIVIDVFDYALLNGTTLF